ncbi:hypothetical protein GCM10009119_13220 [Algoriphagus jejuensis]|uniref:Uncharacterized protein n=1 Tax=Algoriphagus jejuensis TaxID=419934 RepID=A0ABN1MZ22_9BACT
MKTISVNDMAGFDASKFAISEVLLDKSLKAEREFLLRRAILLHYLEHDTAKINFKDDHDEILEVECSVIAVTDLHVILKSGLFLPIHAVVSIELA